MTLSSNAPAGTTYPSPTPHINYHEQLFGTASCFLPFKAKAACFTGKIFLFYTFCLLFSLKCLTWTCVPPKYVVPRSWPIQRLWWPAILIRGVEWPIGIFSPKWKLCVCVCTENILVKAESTRSWKMLNGGRNPSTSKFAYFFNPPRLTLLLHTSQVWRCSYLWVDQSLSA